jgi:D-sedoheptulose 7-phosphate isomerase
VDSSFFIEETIKKHPHLDTVRPAITEAGEWLISCYKNGGKVLVCGNGGSCSDSDHIVGELMKGFEHPRPLNQTLKARLSAFGDRGEYLAGKLQQGLPAISLTVHNSLITAVANDMDANLIFAQQITGYGKHGDILIGISTSGNSQNVVDAIITAKALEMKVIGLTGETGGKMKQYCDILINVPGIRTSAVQELHLPVYHVLCKIVENHFFG